MVPLTPALPSFASPSNAPAIVRRRADWRSARADRLCRQVAAALALLVSPFAHATASAQVAGTLSVDSDFLFRGYSLSDGHPTATMQLSYDAPSGFYLNGAATGVLRQGDPDFLGYQANAGYARRVGTDLSVDGGLVHRWFRYSYAYHGYPYRGSATYDEAYVGLSRGGLSGRVYYSPHYFVAGASTIYGEAEAGVEPASGIRLSGHIGALSYLTSPDIYHFDDRTRLDWRLSASKQIDRFDVHAAVSGGAPEIDQYAVGNDGIKVAIGASASF